MKTTIDGISHFKKFMNFNIPKNIVEVDDSYLDTINYYREWFSNVILIKRKHTNEIIAYQFENGNLFITRNSLNDK